MINNQMPAWSNNPYMQEAMNGAQQSQNVEKSSMQAAANSFDFEYTTKDGDKLTFSMDSSSYTGSKSDANSSTHTLYREFSYQMKYEGNGISEADKKEIARALQDSAPLMEEFFQKSREAEQSALNSFQTNVAQTIKQHLAPLKNPGNEEYVKEQTAGTINDSLQKFDVDETMFTRASKLFEEIFDSSKLFHFYA